MRSRTIFFFVLIFAVGSFALPHLAHAATIPFFGPIIPAANNKCPAGWGMLIDVINNIIIFSITIAIVFIAPIMIAYAGFLYMWESDSPSGSTKARKILLNTVVGIVIALAGWLIVDAIMAVLYNPSSSEGWATKWSSIITSDSSKPCLDQAGSKPGDTLNQATAPGVISAATTAESLKSPPSGQGGTACDPTIVKAAAAIGGYTLTNEQANILACIAFPESSCKSSPPPNGKWNKGTSATKASTAAGAFQVLLASNHDCYENPACYSATGVTTGRLDCQKGFDSYGNPKTDTVGAKVVQTCLNAANNLNCSASAAACLLGSNRGSFSAWQADVKSATQTGCITSGGA